MKQLLVEIRGAVDQGLMYVALASALAIPDMCGWVETPAEQTGLRWKRWFEANVTPEFTEERQFQKLFQTDDLASVGVGLEIDRTYPILDGEEAYALRCTFLHSGKTTPRTRAGKQAGRYRRISLIPLEQGTKWITSAGGDTLDLSVADFCLTMVDAAERWLGAVQGNRKFARRLSTLARERPSGARDTSYVSIHF